ncbi:TonB-dependent receptor [Chromobacterium haemolyticum]|uniref:TonB-dependent receptor n=1 Tax=Chromobacterium haemolyticum TaxID=394935 RepID=UPI000DEF91CB|nr:TonB-dependent siderophore receptor [Chromobacterium haemolyticum]
MLSQKRSASPISTTRRLAPQSAFPLNKLLSATRLALLVGFGGMAVVPAALAQGTDAAPAKAQAGKGAPERLEPVVVQGRRVYAGGQLATDSRVGVLGNLDVMDTPFSTISYTEDYVANQQAREIGALIGAADPSVHVASKGTILEKFNIRGFPTSANDITFNGLIGMAPNLRGSTEMAARVEVLKGPSTLLNGMPPEGSLGGSVNIVPKRAGNMPLTSITATYESDNMPGVHVDVGRRFGDKQQWGVRFNGVYRNGDTAVDKQKQGMNLASLGLDWRGERARVSLDLYRQREKMDGINYFGIFSIAPGVTQVPAPKKGDYQFAPDWATNTNTTQVAVLRGEYELSDALTLYGAYGHRKADFDATITRATLLNNAGDLSGGVYRLVNEGTQKSGEAGVRGHFDTGKIQHKWSLVATRFTSERSYRDGMGPSFTTNYYAPSFGPKPTFRYMGRSVEDKLGSIALVDTLSFMDGKVQWTVGTRRQNVQSSNYNAAGAQTSNYDQSRWSPATALLVKLSDQLSVYGNYIQGLNQGGVAPDTAKNAGESLQPYQTEQYELGAKLDWGGLTHNLSLFQIARPSAYTSPDSNVFGVYGEQRNRGLEWSFWGEASRGLRLMGGASYTKAELTKVLDPAHLGKQATGVPKVMAKLGVEYDIAALPGLTATGNAQYVGERFVRDNNQLSLPSYTLFDLGARYTTKVAAKEITLRATVQNVANRAYWVGSWSGGDGSGLSGGLGAPRTLLLSGTLSF